MSMLSCGQEAAVQIDVAVYKYKESCFRHCAIYYPWAVIHKWAIINKAKSTYTLIKKMGDTVEAFSIVDYIKVFSRNEYKDQRCKHGAKECGCHYYPKLVLVPQQKQ